MFPYVSVIIPVYNGEKLIEKCLNSVAQLDYPKDRYEVIIVDGGSTDKTIEIIKKFPNVKLIKSRKGTSHQRNIGIKEAKGELVALTDADCIVDRNWLKSSVPHLGKDNIAIIGGSNLTPKDSSFLEKSSGYLLSSKLATGTMSTRYSGKGVKEANETDLIACNNIVRKKVIEEIGGFNENFFPAEENELYFRLKQKGYKLYYNSEMIVWHHRKPLFRPFGGQIYTYGKFRAKLIKTKPKIFKPIFILPTLFMLYIICGGIFSALILGGILDFSNSNLFSQPNLISNINLLYFYFGSILFYYFLLLIETSRISIKQKNGKLLFILPLGFFLLHACYGFGFLKGIIKS